MTQLKALLVGEAWGQHEDRFGHALVGPSGRFLGQALSDSNIAPPLPCKYPSELEMISYWTHLRHDLGIGVTNVFNERPPGNQDEYFFDRDGNRDYPGVKIKSAVKYIQPQHVHHVLRLWDEVRTLRPNLIVCMGNIACWGILGRTAITKIRGTVQYAPERLGKLKVLPVYHPAHILHPGGWTQKPVLLADLDKVRREMEFPEIRRPSRWATVVDSIEEIQQWFNREASSYAIDIESGYALYNPAEIKGMTTKMRRLLAEQISMISFARTKSDALLIQFMSRSQPGLCFWPDLEDEAEAWRLVIAGLRRPVRKIFQNGLYDIGRFMAQGIVPTHCYDDTMLRHHSMYSEMLKSLGFLGSLYTDELAWKTAYSNRESLKRDE